eukprot:SAG31_NODE_2258_length_6069_cov_21.781072_1_plen_116_part_00
MVHSVWEGCDWGDDDDVESRRREAEDIQRAADDMKIVHRHLDATMQRPSTPELMARLAVLQGDEAVVTQQGTTSRATVAPHAGGASARTKRRRRHRAAAAAARRDLPSQHLGDAY